MALSFGFYNSINSDRTYDAIQFGQIFDGIIKDGIYATYEKAMVVIASENAGEVIIQPGRAWFNHTWSYNDANYVMEAPAPDVLLERIDALVLDVNTELAYRENSFKWVEGTASSRPERPTLTNTVTHHQYPLCYVHRYPETTMIYTRDITNAVGTSECPFVTGILEGLDIDMWINQWDDEFHTWEDATRTQFEGWMINQQEVYTTWFNSVRSQMEDNMTEFEAWFETIQGIIDEEAATHLQAEIDALAEMLPAGSHIDIHTTEPTLYNRNVTVSDQAGHSKTVKFGATGDATVESFPYVGLLDFVSTDGVRTASSSMTTPYFGRYSVTMAFWAATCNIVSDESFAEIVVTIKDSLGDVKGAVTLDQYGSGVYTATYPDEYTFTLTYGGQTMEVSLAVTQETTYEVELHGGFRFEVWLEAGRVSETFESLDDVLEDEPTLRQLFLVHDSVDYICDSFSEQASAALADITKIFNTDLAIKWINLSDYALDHFEAVPGIKSIMDTIDKYGYGEWALMPQVPRMLNNTAPYGEVIGTTPYQSSANYAAWKAFDGDSSSACILGTVTAEELFIGYNFVNPTIIQRIVFVSSAYSEGTSSTYKIQVSNDGSNWTDIGDSFTVDYDGTYITTIRELNNSNAYSYYRIYRTATTIPNNKMLYCTTVQFYAWGLKGLVPVMTANDAPYGEIIANSEYNSSNRAGYSAFSDDYGNEETVGWTTKVDTTNNWIQYMFINPTIVKKAVVRVYKSGMPNPISVVIQGSHDGITYTDVSDGVIISNNDGSDIVEIDVDTNGLSYLDYRLFTSSVVCTASGGKFFSFQLQFYGRELKGLVPPMSSDTFPSGIVIASGEYATQYAKWKAFDRTLTNSSDCWVPANGTLSGTWIGYSFNKQVSVNSILLRNRTGTTGAETVSPIRNFKIQGSNDGNTWDDIQSYVNPFSQPGNHGDYSITNESGTYSYYRLYVIDGYATNYVAVANLQFYGPDYSEKEFEVGTTKKWLYDHGLDLVDFDKYRGSITSSSPLMNDRNELHFPMLAGTSNTKSNYMVVGKSIDLSNYSIVMMNIGLWARFVVLENTYYSHSILVWKASGIPVSGTYNDSDIDAALHVVKQAQIGGKDYMLNVSALNESKWLSFADMYVNGRECSITEFWLE